MSDTAPLCKCGCGEAVHDRRNGVWAQWRPGHWRRGPGGGVDAASAPARPGSRRPVQYGDPAWLIDGVQLSFDELLP